MTVLGPLRGRRVLVTRGVEKGERLNRLLELAGAVVTAVPLIETERLAVDEEVRAAVARAAAGGVGGWVVFGSETAVRLVADSVGPALRGLRIAAVGPATAAAVMALGMEADLVAGEATSEGLARDLAGHVGASRVLIFAAEGGRVAVAPMAVSAGAEVDTVLLYRSVMPPGAGLRFAAAMAAAVDAVVFTSSSTVRHAGAALAGAIPPACLAACIGAPTAAAATAAGWRDVVTADRPTPEALIEVMVRRLEVPEPLP